MAPWDQIEDGELRRYLDAAMFFMVELGGLDIHTAWQRLDGLWPGDTSPGQDRGLFFHKAPDDLGLDLAREPYWWTNPKYKDSGSMARYALFHAARNDGSWEKKKREAFP